MIHLVFIIIQAALLALNVGMYASTGSAVSLGASIFIACMFVVTFVNAVRAWSDA